MTVSLINPEVLLLLERETEKYPAMVGFLAQHNLSTGSLLSTRGVSLVDAGIHSDTNLVVECFTFLDTLAFFDAFYTQPNSSLSGYLLETLAVLRTTPEPKMVTNTAAIAEYTTNNLDEMRALLRNNQPILALTILAILRTVYYK
jgi:hypothetical protein